MSQKISANAHLQTISLQSRLPVERSKLKLRPIVSPFPKGETGERVKTGKPQIPIIELFLLNWMPKIR